MGWGHENTRRDADAPVAAPERPKKTLLKTFFTQLIEYKEKVYICTLIRKTGF
jgi:hypothetical protein